MKKAIIAFTILFALVAAAVAVPQYINYQGILRDSGGNLENGTFPMTFKIYSVASSGTALYTETESNVSVSNGLYNVELGPVTSTLFDGGDRWLEITVGTDMLSPRLKINSVAHAIRADIATTATSATTAGSATTASYAALAGTVSDEAISTAKIQDGAVNGDKLSGNITGNINITTTGNIATNGLTINGILYADAGIGKSPGAKVCGMASIEATEREVIIDNSNVSPDSIILVTQGEYSGGNFDHGGVYVVAKTTDQFTVRVGDGTLTDPGQRLKIYYLIIN